MINIPDSYCLMVHLTLRCNMCCSYCIQNFDRNRQHYDIKEELTTQEWIDGINKFSGKLITLSGGEVTLRKDLPEIIQGIKNFSTIHLGTNLLINPKEYINKCKDQD